jgi:anti-sigma factor RsiW
MKRRVTCRDGVLVLMDYTEGVLPAPRRKAVEAHVGGCRRCQGFVRSYRETPRILREATVTSLPERLGRRLHRMVAALSPCGRNRTRRRIPPAHR